MRGSVRAFFAVLLLALFPFFVLALGVGGVVAGLTIGHRAGMYVAILAAGMMLALGLALAQALRTRLEPPSGPVLTRQEQPGLWRLVDEHAAQAQTRSPDEIVLVGEINAAVREDARALGLKEGKRYMMIGLPLLAGLNVTELRSVLAHELGHYGGGHTRLLAVSYRGAETLGLTVSRLDSGPARWILGAYAWLYAVVSRSANRAQELQAAAYSVAAAGSEAAASALRKIATMDLLWEAYGERFLGLPSLAGRTPDILLGFRNFLDHPQQRRIVAEIEPKVLDNQPSSLFDSHPTIRRRIEKIGAMPAPPARPDQRPAWTVLADPARVVPAAEARLYIKGELGPRASWSEIVRIAGAASAARGAELLAGAGRESRAAPGGTLGELLAAIQHGRIDQLMSPLLEDGGNPEQAREGLVELLGDVIVCALIAQRRAHHELSWGGGRLITGPQGELKVTELVAPAVRNPALVPQFAQRLTALGVRMDFVRRPTAAPPRPAHPAGGAEPQLVGVAPEVMAFKKNWDVLVFDAGLLLVPLKAGKLAGQSLAGAVGQGGHAQRKRVTGLLELGQAELFGQPGVRWLPTGTVLGGDRKKFLTGGGKIALRFAGGETATLRTQHDGGYESLTRFLDTVPRGQPVGSR
ncbi:peptidase M48 Ste24p [Prauserella sp. PE36]|uniref:M48 family metallopeptidase n=1 Tax=Prauserella sp. PE36 TaxID=1504709 RepID=UPI000DE1E9C9|nr:M48 family metallopeptidase [Prauserella sp. PE36]RBM19178.1 peptidase M48 Ste24p [Prauserella sp. PE36]